MTIPATVQIRETAVSPNSSSPNQNEPTSSESTPLPTAPKELVIGGHAIVINTGGQALIARSEPGTEHEIVTRFPEGSRLLILDGPQVAGEFTWWQVQGESEAGWCADRWLQPDRN